MHFQKIIPLCTPSKFKIFKNRFLPIVPIHLGHNNRYESGQADFQNSQMTMYPNITVHHHIATHHIRALHTALVSVRVGDL